MANPLITIGITCYKEGDWLLECWASVLAQTDDRWTAVLVMDGTDHQRTREIFHELQHPRLRKYAMPRNMGPYPARNKAFEMTATPYHFYLDADDQLVPTSIERVLETFERFPDAGFVYGDIQAFGGSSRLFTFPPSYGSRNFSHDSCTTGPAAYRKDLWTFLGGYSDELARGAADFDFLIGAFEAGCVGRHCGSVVYRYRTGTAQKVSESYTKQYYEKLEIIVRRHPAFFAHNRFRREFLAIGYKTSALQNYVDGNFEEASRLAWIALRYGKWLDAAVWSSFMSGVLPISAYKAVQRSFRLARQLHTAIFGLGNGAAPSSSEIASSRDA